MACRLVTAIIWTNAGILLIRTFDEIVKKKSYIFIQENVFKNVFCEMAKKFVSASMC